MELRDFFSRQDLSSNRILIVGYGVEGRSSADFLLSKNCQIAIFDEKNLNEFEQEEIDVLNNHKIEILFGQGKTISDSSRNFDYVIRSPGVALDSGVISDLKAAGNKIISATQIFMALCPAPVIGVTGTKGKGTTSALINEILCATGYSSYLGGNIGTPALSLLPNLKSDSWAVLEMSSFQLEDLEVSPHIGVVLMITEDHLDYHHTVENYRMAKSNIAKHQSEKDFLVFNPDYPPSFRIATLSRAEKFGVSAQNELQQGCYALHKHIYITREGAKRKLIDIADVQLPGRHNLENVCAAAMAASLAGVNDEIICETLKRFQGLEHRLEFVREVDEVRFYNDSFSTNPASAIAAVQAFHNSEILILGGSGKGADFSGLAKAIVAQRGVHAIIGIDPEWQRIKVCLEMELSEQGRSGEIKYFENQQNIEWIVRAAKKSAFPGDIVLLSPACASFGMFKNYKERGRLFKKAVNEL